MLPAAVPSRQHTVQPMVTGTSVLGIVYDRGVLLAADTLLSYGSMAKAQNIPRLHVVEKTVIGASGEYSDFQRILEILKAKALQETTTSVMDSLYTEESGMTAENTWNYLRMLLYSRRSKFNPFWNELLVAGTDLKGKPFLGSVDKIGTTVRDNFIATGFGAYLAMPLLREKWRPDLTEGEARALLEDCMKILFFRDCRASPRIQLAKCADDEVLVSEPYELDTAAAWQAEAYRQSVGELEDDGGW